MPITLATTGSSPVSTPALPRRLLSVTADSTEDPTDGRFLSEADCAALAKRVAGMAVGGGNTQTVITSTWTGAIRWSRNRLRVAEDWRANHLRIVRDIRGASQTIGINQIDPQALEAAVRRAERLLQFSPETQASAYQSVYTEQYLRPTIWSNATYRLEAEARAEVARALIRPAEQAGVVAAGDIEISAYGDAVMDTWGRAMYYPYTEARYTVTVRDPQHQASGWVGASHYDWTKIDTHALTQRALEKCLASRNPVALEPGRYTAIFEPEAAAMVIGSLFAFFLDRVGNEVPYPNFPYNKSPNQSRLGEVVMDPRLSASMDPMDPELGFVPFWWNGKVIHVYHPAEWVKRGVLTNLAYDIDYATTYLGKNSGLPTSGGFRIRSSTPPTSLEEMIATTPRGLLVSRLYSNGHEMYTRDGLWLVEKGKVSKPVKNFIVDYTPIACVQPSQLEQIGAPERVYSPGRPQLVPAIKVRDFNFMRMVDAI